MKVINLIGFLYWQIVPFIFIVVLFTNAIIYLPEVGIIPLQPFQIIILFFILSVPFLFKENKYRRIFSNRVFVWTVFYWLISFIFFSLSSAKFETALQQFKNISIASIVLICGTLIFNNSTVKKIDKTILFCTIIGIILNFYDFLNPLSISNNIGRSAGMYLNPNITALALTTGLTFSIKLIKKRGLQLIYIFFVGLAVITTFSRAGILSFIITFLGICYFYRINPFYPILVFILIIFTALHFNFYGISDVLETEEITILLDRINILGDGSATDDFSSFERKKLLEKGLEIYINNPIFGIGVGGGHEISGAEYSNQSTHNQFVFLMVEYGFFGIIIIFSFFKFVFGNLTKLKQEFEVGLFFCLFFVNCFFSHNMFETYFLVLVTSFIPYYTNFKSSKDNPT